MGSSTASSRSGLLADRRLPLYALQAFVGAAFVLSDLLLTKQTSLAQEALIIAGAMWLVGSLLPRDLSSARRWRPRDATFNPTTLFFAVVAATFTIFALDGVVPKPTEFNANAPDSLPGLATTFTPYYLGLLAASVLFATWFARSRDRETETGVALLVVYTSVAFEEMLRVAGSEAAPFNSTLSIPMLWGTLLVLVGLWLTNERAAGLDWRWTPFAGPMLVLLAAGALSTITSMYVHGSLTVLLRIGAFATLFWLVANVVRGERQMRLLWLAMVAPAVGASLTILVKLVQLSREMGLDFVLSLRYQASGVAGTNPLGLSLGLGVLLVIGAIVVQGTLARRVAVGLLLVPLVPAFLATHSPAGLFGLILALGGLVAVRYGGMAFGYQPRRLSWRIAAPALAVVALAAAIVVPNAYSNKLMGDVQDPSTGRNVRSLVWGLSVDDIRAHPALGVGLQNYYARAQEVGDFPTQTDIGVRERITLVGGDREPWKIFVTSHPHNAFLALTETMGIPGVIAIGWLAVALALQAWTLIRRADGSFAWWAAVLPMAGVGMTLFWNFVAQGEDITILALPFWPLLGVAAAAGYVLREGERKGVSPWRRFIDPPVQRWGALSESTRARIVFAAFALAFLALVARPVAAEALAFKSDAATEDIQPRRARDLAQWAHRLDPWNAAYLERLSNTYLAAGPFHEAIDTQRDVISLRRDFAPDQTRLGWLLWLANQPDESVPAFERGVKEDPWDATHGDVYTALGLAYAYAGRHDDSIRTLALGMELGPSSVMDSAWESAEAVERPLTYVSPLYFVRSGPISRDLQDELILRLDLPARKPAVAPPVASPDYRLPVVLDRMHVDYQQLAGTDPSRAESVLFAAGQVAYRAGLAERAVGYYEELRGLQPDKPTVRYNLGLAYLAAGDLDKAADEFLAVRALADETNEYVIHEPFSDFQLGVIALLREPPDPNTARTEFEEAQDVYRWDYFPNLSRYLALADGLLGRQQSAEDELDREQFMLDLHGGGAPPALGDADATETPEQAQR